MRPRVGQIRYILIIFAVVLYSTVATDATALPVITITDTNCLCSSASIRQFDCAPLLRRVHRRSRKNSSYKSRTRQSIVQFLDSLGYLHWWSDVTRAGAEVFYTGERSLIVAEQIIDNQTSLTEDTTDIITPWVLPRPFDAAVVKARAEELNSVYTQHGYPFAQVTITMDALPAAGAVHSDSLSIAFRVDPERQYRFAQPQLRGTVTTQKRLLLHDVAITPGALFNSAALDRTREQLVSRSYIASVELLQPVVVTVPGDSIDALHEAILVPIMITDRSGMGLDGAAGLAVEQTRDAAFYGKLSFSFANLFHRGEKAVLGYTGDRDRQQLDIGFMQPWFFNLPFTMRSEGGLEIFRDRYGYLYGKLGMLTELGTQWRAGFDLNMSDLSAADDTTITAGSYWGADLSLFYLPGLYRRGVWARELAIQTGSGIARKESLFSRSHIDFLVGGQIPFFTRQALVLRAVSRYLATRETNLAASEMFRVGGTYSLRGYEENAFAFRTVLYGQCEYRYYFQSAAAASVFCDGGIGFTGQVGFNQPWQSMLGYGVGVRLPVKIGTMALEWARNYQDVRSMGRIHVRVQHDFSESNGTFFSFAR